VHLPLGCGSIQVHHAVLVFLSSDAATFGRNTDTVTWKCFTPDKASFAGIRSSQPNTLAATRRELIFRANSGTTSHRDTNVVTVIGFAPHKARFATEWTLGGRADSPLVGLYILVLGHITTAGGDAHNVAGIGVAPDIARLARIGAQGTTTGFSVRLGHCIHWQLRSDAQWSHRRNHPISHHTTPNPRCKVAVSSIQCEQPQCQWLDPWR
jgi:hypothetical protein